MKKTGYSFKTTFLYGLMVVIPLGVLVLLIAKVVEILQLVALSLKLESTVNAVWCVRELAPGRSKNSSRQSLGECQATSSWEISSRISPKRKMPTRR